MKKIVHLGKYYFPDTGGIESVTVSVANGAVSRGDDVTVVCFAQNTPPAKETIGGVKVVRCRIDKLVASQPLGWDYVTSTFRSWRGADLVHLHAPNMLGALLALMAGRKRLLVHWHSDVINKGLLGKLLAPLEYLLLKRADVIIAATQVYADASRTLAPFLHKVKVVPYGVQEPRRFTEQEIGAAIDGELAERIRNRRVILAVGRLVPYKGFDILIKAASHLPDDVVIVVVGGGPLHDALSAQAAAAGVSHKVFLAGRLPERALSALFHIASLFCFPSTYRAEAFGVVLLEAMAYGLPIVASDIPGSGTPWVNQHDTSGLNVPVGDHLALAAACTRILESDALRQRYIGGARARFATEFTEEVSVAKVLAIYDAILAR